MLLNGRQLGFTLIELMVVLVIIGLFSSMLMLTVSPNNGRDLERESKRLLHSMKLAQDEAVLKGLELGFTLQHDHYYYSRLQGNEWLPLSQDKQFSSHELNKNIELVLEIENEQVIEQADESSDLPSIMILSSGEITGFKIALFYIDQPDQRFQLIGQENGQLFLQKPDE
jgi:general secretion pathway protein H